MTLSTNMKEVFARRRARLGDPPTPETLAAYRDGRLTDDEKERLLEYASVDPETAQAVLDAVRFPDLPAREDEKPLSAEEREAQWQQLRTELVKAELLPPKPLASHERADRTFKLRSLLPMAAAVVIAAGLGFLVASQRQPVLEPSAQVLSSTLYPEDGKRLVRADGAALALSEDAEQAVLGLVLEHEEVFSRYRVELRDARDRLLWQGEAVPEKASRLVVTLPRSYLRPGRLRILVFGAGPAAEPLPIASYSVRIDPPPV